MIENAPLPEVDGESAPFWEGTAAGELRMQTCASCGRRRFPPRPMCPWCRSLESRWDRMSGRGRVWSFVVPHPPLLPAFDALAPYNVVVVTLEEDETLRLVGNVVADPDASINSIAPDQIEIGQPVQVVFQAAGEDITLPRWTLRGNP
jgi:uncharacterized OB-fold protein